MKRKQKFNASKLAKAVINKRIKDNLSLRDIEKSEGISITTIRKVEAQTMVPGADNLAKICNWLGKNVQDFF